MAKAGILGAGAFGTAMACVLRRSGHEVALWAREPEVAASINREHVNRLFLPGVRLDPAIAATGDPAAAAAGADFLLIATPAQHVRKIAFQLRDLLKPGLPVVSCSKGIELGSLALMPEVLAETLPQAKVAVLSGPSFASEIAINLPCGVTLASNDLDLSRRLSMQIQNAKFCVHPSDDPIGAAIGGVMKNVVAIACGAAAGRKLGENARATLLTLGLEETIRLGVAKGAKAGTFMGLAGVGDMMLTAGSLASRNTALGVALAECRTATEIVAQRKEVTEGALSAGAIVELARRLGVDMPLASAVDRVLNHGASVDEAIALLATRARRAP
jgi:glycerol-3-phosphate dehydrogenase (NAD(P)+)